MAKAGLGEGHLAAPVIGGGGARGGIEVCSQLDLGVLSIFTGQGVPGPLVNGAPPVVGDLYFRLDGGAASLTVGTTLYRCTSLGPVVWTPII